MSSGNMLEMHIPRLAPDLLDWVSDKHSLYRTPSRGSFGFDDPQSYERPSSYDFHSRPVPALLGLWTPLPMSSHTCFFVHGFLSVTLLFSLLGHPPSAVIYPLSRPQTVPSGHTSVPSYQQVPRPLPGLSLSFTAPKPGEPGT